MRILHTSDWHIGNSFFSFNREDEFRFFIEELAKIVKEYRPDILIIAGDIYDNANPTLNSRRLFTDALLSLLDVHPNLKTISTAGNHDSGSNLEVLSPLYKDEIAIVGRTPQIKRFVGNDGVGAVIIATPYISENGFRCRLTEELATCENPRKEFYNLLLGQTKNIAQKGDAIILIAHEAISNSDFAGQERYNFNFCSLESLGSGYNYLALGHIHRPQTIFDGGNTVARYSGAPLAMGFDEAYEHSVTIIDVSSASLPPKVQVVKINQLMPMLTLPEDNALEEEEAITYVEQLIKKDTKGYLRLRVNSTHPLPSLNARLRNVCADSNLRFCLLKLENEGLWVSDETNTLNRFSVADLHTVDPLNLALDYYKRKTGNPMGEEMKRCLYEIIAETAD